MPTNAVISVNDPNLGFVCYQIHVQSTGPVNISNLVVDGGPLSAGFCPANQVMAGTWYSDSSGTVDDVSLRNQASGFGEGLVIDTTASTPQTETIENSVIRGFNSARAYAFTGQTGGGVVTADVTTNTIGSNTGFDISFFGSAGAVTSSSIIGTAIAGIYLQNSTVTATGNTISVADFGIDLVSRSNTVKSNKINAGGYTGIELVGQASNSEVESNTITNSATAVNGCSSELHRALP